MTDRSESYKVNDANGNEVVYQEFVSASNPGQSYYRTADGRWIDCWNENPEYSLGNVRIKAFTKSVSVPISKSADPFSDSPGAPQLFVIDQEDRPGSVPHF